MFDRIGTSPLSRAAALSAMLAVCLLLVRTAHGPASAQATPSAAAPAQAPAPTTDILRVVPAEPPSTAPTSEARPAINVPLVVSIYRGSVVDRDEIDLLLQRVNDIYAQANVRFTLVKAQINAAHPDEGWTPEHREQLRAHRRGHLDHLFGRLGGVSINFTHQPKASKERTNGLAYGESGVVLLRRHPTGLDKTAETLAHELAHTLGLGDLYEPEAADRLRYGYSRSRTGTVLSNDDIAQIRAAAAIRAGEAPLLTQTIREAAATAVTSTPQETSTHTTSAP